MKRIRLILRVTCLLFGLIPYLSQAQECNNGDLVINQNFNSYNGQNRQYTSSMLQNDFPNVSARTSGEIRGIGSGWPQETRVIDGALRAEYIKNAASGRNGGFLFDSSFPGAEEAVLEYKVKFDKDFVFATGGKLPGLGGSSQPQGGLPAGCTQNQSVVQNAFSLRLMWRRNREQTQAPYLILYDYLPGRTTRCGGNTVIIRNIEKDQWYTIRQYVKLNTPGQKNGIIKIWVDDQLQMDLDDVELRLAGKGNVKINALVAHTYRGGNATDPVWWSPTTDYAYFDDFKVWTNCSEPGGGSNEAPNIAFTQPSGNLTLQEGYSQLEIVANANDSDGDIDNVKLFIDNELVRQENVAPYTWGMGDQSGELDGRPAGTYTVRAVATDNDGATSEDTFTSRIQAPSQAPVVAFTKPTGNLSVEEGYQLDVVVAASDADGTVSNVKLFIDDQLIRQESVAPYEWGHAGSPDPNELNELTAGTYIFKAIATDNEGNTASDTFILTVQDSGNGGGTTNCSFGAPMNNGLPAMDKISYSNVHVLGNGGPLLNNFREFTVNWAPQNNGLYQFGINTNNGSPDWYVELKNTMTYQLQNARPEVTLSGTGFSGLDGSYWVSLDNGNFVLVSKSGGYSIYFSNASIAPSCTASTARMAANNYGSQTSVESISGKLEVYPNPSNDRKFYLNTSSDWTVYDLNGQKLMHGKGQEVDLSGIKGNLFLLKTKSQSLKLITND